MIKEIINKELIEIHFQPIVSIRSKKLYAFEALTRCTYKGEVIPPYELFKLAIDANLNLELDVLTRNKSIEKFKNYYLQNNELILFLNFEPSLINNFNADSSIDGTVSIYALKQFKKSSYSNNSLAISSVSSEPLQINSNLSKVEALSLISSFPIFRYLHSLLINS